MDASELEWAVVLNYNGRLRPAIVEVPKGTYVGEHGCSTIERITPKRWLGRACFGDVAPRRHAQNAAFPR